MSGLNCSKVRDQHKMTLFVQHLLFWLKTFNFWYDKHEWTPSVSIEACISSKQLCQLLVKYFYPLHREHCHTLSSIASKFIFSNILEFVLNLSFSFKQNLVHLFWAACKRALNFLFAFGRQTLHAYFVKKG